MLMLASHVGLHRSVVPFSGSARSPCDRFSAAFNINIAGSSFQQGQGLWVRDGATPWQALVAATRHGAAVCGVSNELGTIEVGKLADLIVVGGNPLEDIQNVRQLKLVLKEGVIVSDKRE
jgi:imidazolonepropionase-like amidohydrolase